MTEDIKLSEVLALIIGNMIPFFVPEDKLSLEHKLLIVSLIIIIFLIYKLYNRNVTIKKYKYENHNIQNQFIETENKHNELSILFDKRIKTIDELNSSIHNYNHLLLILENFLVTALSTKEENKQIINNLLTLVLQYKKYMEDDRHEQS